MSGLFRLDGKRALITGASRGLGRGIAMALAEAGALVTLCARPSADLDEAAAEIRAEHGTVEVLALDITDTRGFAAAVAGLPAFDIFVNNAGTNRPKPLAEVTEDDFDAVMNLNLRAALFAAKAVADAMVASGRGGAIINMSSQMGHVGAANRTLYCASKWALEGFTRSLAVELAPAGIRVNTVCPTFVDTPMTRPFFEDPAFRDAVLGKIKLGRLGRIEEVAAAVVYLSCDAAALMTGSSLMLDGGWTAD